MSQLQKYAWWNLAVLAFATALYLVGLLLVGPRHAMAGFGLLGLWGFGPFFVRKGLGAFILRKRRDGRVVWDEREDQIWKQSWAVGYSVFWLAFVAACMLPWAIHGPNGAVPFEVLPLYLGGGATILIVTQSIVILVQYARGDVHVTE